MRIICLSILLASLHLAVNGQASFEEKVTSASNIGMTINNLGLVGNSFGGSFDLLGYPSCEYPVNSGVEHVFDGGLWVGAKIDGGVVAVSSGAIDASSGFSTGSAGFEFSADIGSGLQERSSLFDSPYYLPTAISHQDFVADFTDRNILVPGTTIQIAQHDNPLNINVHFEAYNWNFTFANFFVILNFEIENVGTSTLVEPYVGFWMDGVIRNVNITPPGGTAFFNKGGNGYIDSLYMAYEFDATGDPGFTDSYVGLKFLGAEFNNCTNFIHPAVDSNVKLNFNSWQFRNAADPLYFYPTTDDQMYQKMAAGLNFLPNWKDQIRPNLKTPNNRSNLISVGPLPNMMPGDKATVAFAIVCGRKKNDGNPNTTDNDEQKENLIKNSFWAQTAFNGEDRNFNGILDPGEDLNGNGELDPGEDVNGNGVLDGKEDQDGDGCITRYILPTPPAIPTTKIVAGDNKIEVYWSDNAESSIDPISKKKDFEGYRIYKTRLGFDIKDVQDIDASLNLVASWDSVGNGLFFDVGFDEVLLPGPLKFEGDSSEYHYKFVFDKIQNGWQHAVAVTAFDEGDAETQLESLESSRLANLKRVFAGKPGNKGFENGDPFVYPNPYYAGASWEGASTFEEDRKLMFANLPPRSEIRIYTVAGDFVDLLNHDEAYNGDDIRWFNTYSDSEKTQFSGGEHGWDLLSKDNQIIARGIYLFSVKDLDSGKIFKGKFVVIK